MKSCQPMKRLEDKKYVSPEMSANIQAVILCLILNKNKNAHNLHKLNPCITNIIQPRHL